MFAPDKTVQMQIAALSAYLKKLGCDVRYLEIILLIGETFDAYKERVKKEVQEYQPDMVGFSSYDLNYFFILECSDYIKSISGAKIIVGGQSASLVPDEFMPHKSIDYVCIGEGEPVLRDLLSALDRNESVSRIPGLCSKGGDGEITYNPAGPLQEDLDTLPLIDRTIVHAQQLEISYLPMLVGKGCPYKCTYCADESMKNLYPNKNEYVRYRSPESIIEELKQCSEIYDFDYVYFYDDIFGIDYDWLQKFGEQYKKHFPSMPFRCLLRPEIASKEKFTKYLSEIGCMGIMIGVESGAEEFRKRMLVRGMTNKSILNAAAMIKKYNLDLNIFLIVGFPDETLRDMLQSFILNLKIRPNGVMTSIFLPLKGTPLYKYCAEKKLINEERRRKMLVFTYSSCLNYNIFKRAVIVFFKWVNSATPLICHFKLSVIRHFVLIQFNKWFRKKIDYTYKRRNVMASVSLKKSI